MLRLLLESVPCQSRYSLPRRKTRSGAESELSWSVTLSCQYMPPTDDITFRLQPDSVPTQTIQSAVFPKTRARPNRLVTTMVTKLTKVRKYGTEMKFKCRHE